MTVGAWLACGGFAAALAWLGRPDASADGPATTLAASLCGGFLGGALVVLIAGDEGVFASLSVCAAAVGAIADAGPGTTSLRRVDYPTHAPIGVTGMGLDPRSQSRAGGGRDRAGHE